MATPAASDGAADGGSALVNISCFDLLLIELVPLAERMARAYEASLDRPASSPAATKRGTSTKQQPSPTPLPAAAQNTTPSTGASAGPVVSGTLLAADGLPETDIFRDSMYVRLERLGFRVGEGLSERFSRDRPRFTDHLDVIKFLCKDLWTVVFKKQIDNLKTNHRVRF